MSKDQAIATWKSILRNHPFFQSGGMYGWDWRTFNMVYPRDCTTLKEITEIATGKLVRFTLGSCCQSTLIK